MININISTTLADNIVRATVRYTVEEHGVMGVKKDSWTQEQSLELIGGCVLGKTEVIHSVFGPKTTTMVVEGIEGLSLPLITEVSERHTVFGTNSVTIVRIKTKVEAMLDQSEPVRASRPMPGRPIASINISMRRAERPGWRR